MSPDVLASLSPSLPRRVLGLGFLVALAATLAWTAMNSPDLPPVMGWVMWAVAIAIIPICAKGWQVTGAALELTEHELRLSSGETLARLDEIEKVDRGAFAMKPSGGFVIDLKAKGPTRWAPGLYWQMGRRIGVGGLVSPAAARAMADTVIRQMRGEA